MIIRTFLNHIPLAASGIAIFTSCLPGVEWAIRIAVMLLAGAASIYSIQASRNQKRCKECPYNPESIINQQTE